MQHEVRMNYFSNKSIAVTGACGTVGRELVRQLLERHQPGELLCIDNNESEVFFLEQRFSRHKNTVFVIADIRDAGRLRHLFGGVDIVFHTAAYKHVILCERSPVEAVLTNIHGVSNVIEAALRCGVGRVVFTSSDKAVNPTNVMGTSKLMGERLMTAANSAQRGQSRTIFASTRFGNVLGSRGSVIPIFHRQIAKGGPVTLTDERMTRFVMSIQEAVRLVIDTATLACGGEVFVTKMPVARISDLAGVMIRELAPRYGHAPEDVRTQIIGLKPGEKLYEELMSGEETRRAVELELYYAVLPAFRSLYREIEYRYPSLTSSSPLKAYTSEEQACMKENELLDFLTVNNLLREQLEEQPDQRYWP
jgi:FlaA1/EpsC-like NDP-sugar epimerase